MRERRRLLDRGWDREDRSVAIAHLADTGEVGWDRGRRIGEPGDALLAHALRNLAPVRHRLGGGVRRRARARGRSCRAGKTGRPSRDDLGPDAALEGEYEAGIDQ